MDREGHEQVGPSRTLIRPVFLILLFVVLLLSIVAYFIPLPNISPEDAQMIMCGTNLSGFGKAILFYAAQNEGRPPEPNQWCDLLITEADVGLKQFICKGSYVSEHFPIISLFFLQCYIKG